MGRRGVGTLLADGDQQQHSMKHAWLSGANTKPYTHTKQGSEPCTNTCATAIDTESQQGSKPSSDTCAAFGNSEPLTNCSSNRCAHSDALDDAYTDPICITNSHTNRGANNTGTHNRWAIDCTDSHTYRGANTCAEPDTDQGAEGGDGLEGWVRGEDGKATREGAAVQGEE